MIDRSYEEKAADSGVRKLSLLQSDPGRYVIRSVLAGMYLSIVLFVYWSLLHKLHDTSLGKVIASAFFGVGLTIIVFTNAELFTSNNMYLAISSAEGRTSWGQTVLLWITCYLGNLIGALLVAGLLYGAGTLKELGVASGSRPVQRGRSQSTPKCDSAFLQRDSRKLGCLLSGTPSFALQR